MRIFETNLDTVRPEWRGLYEQRRDGTFMLVLADWDSLGDVEDVRGLRSALAKSREENKELRMKLSETLAKCEALSPVGEMLRAKRPVDVKAGLLPRRGTP